MSNYTTKFEVKKARNIDTSEFAKKVDLSSLKSKVNKLDVDKIVPTDLNKLSNVVEKDVAKKIVYDELV